MRLAMILLLIPSSVFAIEYGPALDAAQKAALIQTGIQDKITLTGDWLKNQVVEAGLGDPLAAILYCGKTYRDKALSFPVGKQKRIELRRDGVGLTLGF